MTFCEIEDPGSLRAFHWTENAGITAFSGFADYPLSQATGISADGSLVVGNEYTYLTYGYCFVDSFQRCQGFRDIRLPLRSLNQAAAEAPFGLLPGDIVAAVSADGSTPCWA
jgi:hypothetical protein